MVREGGIADVWCHRKLMPFPCTICGFDVEVYRFAEICVSLEVRGSRESGVKEEDVIQFFSAVEGGSTVPRILGEMCRSEAKRAEATAYLTSCVQTKQVVFFWLKNRVHVKHS